jgi:acetyl esterase/lipase
MRHRVILALSSLLLLLAYSQPINSATVAPAISQSEPPQPAGMSPLPAGIHMLHDLAYVPGGHERQKLDLYLPAKATSGPLPVIVWIHGGGWWEGNKDWRRAVPLVLKGYAVANINYRLSQHAVFPAQIEDCKAAIRWLKANAKNYNLDRDRFGVWGPSAGGHLAALLGTTGDTRAFETIGGNLNQSSRVQCVVDWFGPTDLATMGSNYDQPNSSVARLIGGPVRQYKDRAARASPLTYVSTEAAPFLIMHGDQDDCVPLSQSEKLANALRKAGVDVTFRVYHGAGHGGHAFTTPESWKMIEDFFDRHLRGRK